VVSIVRDGPNEREMMNTRETYERPKTNAVKVATSCLTLLFLLGAVTATVTLAVVLVVRLVG
jgi:hypothetical protein